MLGQTDAFDQLHRPASALCRIGDRHQCQFHVLKNRKTVDDVVILEDKRDVLLAVLLPVRLKIV